MPEIGDEIRAFVQAFNRLAQESRVLGVITPIVANASDHLLLRARESDRLQAKDKPSFINHYQENDDHE